MLTEERRKMLEFYNEGLKLYKEMKFKQALKLFKTALKHDPQDGPTRLYIARCIELSKNPPPPDWDGVFTMTTK
jgi:Tfp pilus assembly protein PilF